MNGNYYFVADVNECSSLGGASGHHCLSPNSVCVNTVGSYRCEK